MFALERRGQCAIAAALALGALQFPWPASAASAAAFCASGAGPRAPVPVPPGLEAEVARTFDIPIEMVRDGAVMRCAGTRLLACAVGANLNCGKANARRSLPGASAFCRVNPDAGVVPMAATGHDTIYDWRCVGRRAVAGKTVVAVDNDGYDAENWKEVGR
jgi:hypothetical protein